MSDDTTTDPADDSNPVPSLTVDPEMQRIIDAETQAGLFELARAKTKEQTMNIIQSAVNKRNGNGLVEYILRLKEMIDEAEANKQAEVSDNLPDQSV